MKREKQKVLLDFEQLTKPQKKYFVKGMRKYLSLSGGIAAAGVSAGLFGLNPVAMGGMMGAGVFGGFLGSRRFARTVAKRGLYFTRK